jgi:hypothetical protein
VGDEFVKRWRFAVGARYGEHAHLLAQIRVREADGGAFDDGRVVGDQRLDLGRADVHAATDDDVLGPVDELQQPRRVVAGDVLEEVAGAVPAVGVEFGPVAPDIAVKDGDASEAQLADGSRSGDRCLVLEVDQFDLDTGPVGDRKVAGPLGRIGYGLHRRQQRGAFVRPEHVGDLDAAVLPSLDHPRIEGC